MSKKSLNSPRLRTVEKVTPPFPLNQFPKDFGFNLGKELIYLLAIKSRPSLEGKEWEEIFANCINAEWKPSNVGLDDIVLKNCAWGAKTVIGRPQTQQTVRLISGRNSPAFSFGESKVTDVDPNHIGQMVLEIWNERVSAVREKFKHLRSIVLIRAKDLQEVAVFEFDTIRYDPELFTWVWNKRNNLEGFDKKTKTHKFTWQPHGSQFTIIEDVPEKLLVVRVKPPEKIDKEELIKIVGFAENWIEITTRNG